MYSNVGAGRFLARRLHWNVAVLLGRPQLALAAHGLERVDQSRTGLARLDDGVDVAAAGGDVGVGEEPLVLLDLLLALGSRVAGIGDLLAVDDVGRALGAHDGDLRRGPGEGHVRAQVARA